MKIVFFTGAGISAESGIQTFRDYDGNSNSNGFENLLTLSNFNKDPELTWNWLNGFLESIKDKKPNKAHKLIASLNAPVITQNIDTFHQLAGSKYVIELHGTLGNCTCINCKKTQPIIDICECGSFTKPQFTFYEEDLDLVAYKAAEDLAKDADIFVIVGTSGQVYPAAKLPKIAKKHGAKIYEINPGSSDYSYRMIDKYIKASASEGIEGLLNELEISSL